MKERIHMPRKNDFRHHAAARALTLPIALACGFSAFMFARPHPVSADPGPDLTIDLTAGRHPISPDIYGMNDNPYDLDMGRELQVPVSRWGGDATSRYNWKVDSSNSGDDWFFMAGSNKEHTNPSESADKFIEKAKYVGGKALLTIPVIDYINRSSKTDCSYPVSIFGKQQKVNPYVHPIVNGAQTDAGNGRTPDGKPIILKEEEILRVHIPNTPQHQKEWIAHLVKNFGNTAHGGVAVYEMDNEPGGWANTHRDIHPNAPTYQEITDKTIPYARAVKQGDPTAKIDGPGDFGWAVYKGDPQKTGGLWNAEYYLKRFHDEDKKGGKRLLDYFDEHYYPVHQDGENDATRLESTRSLWDPAYVEKNWIGQWNGPINLIPRMHGWVDKYYPGTKLAITEYNFGDIGSLTGALAQADALGIFGREGLDLATIWGPPKPDDPGAYAFRIYRNYDGSGAKYGSIWVKSVSADQGKLAVYGAQRQSDHALTVVIINKTGGDLTSRVSLAHIAPAIAAQVFRYSADDLKSIKKETDQPLDKGGFSAVFPANSITLMVIPQGAHSAM